ncbi:MAG: hypothetical protein GYA14_12945 [Ignavibacteria bacterium]|nr:hypothetical protein [Ignavibacteria bacterium]
MINKYLIVIHTFNNPKLFLRLLSSINANKETRNNPILILDDSNRNCFSEMNLALLNQYPDILKFYVNKSIWHQIKNEWISPQIENVKIERYLNTIDLGKIGWNIYNARNIGLILSTIFLNNTSFSLSLDQDIIIDNKFSLHNVDNLLLTCTNIRGCPDLSRLEWIGLFLGYLCNMTNFSFTRVFDDYVNKLFWSLPTEHIGIILSRYTQFPILSFCQEKETTKTMTFPPREEYYGASFILSNSAINLYPFSNWYDNDWLFFKSIRGNLHDLHFYQSYVDHEQEKKEINSIKWLEFEETGKILNEIYYELVSRKMLTDNAYENIVNRRINIIENEIRYCKLILKDGSVDERLLTIINQILSNLQMLKVYVRKLNKTYLESQAKSFIYQIALWRELIYKIIHFKRTFYLTNV